MTVRTDSRMVQFLRATLALWGVEGTVEGSEAPAVAIIRVGEHGAGWIVVERAASDEPFRWHVRRVGADALDGPSAMGSSRPCGSLVGVLGALRRTLAIDTGAQVRIARSGP